MRPRSATLALCLLAASAVGAAHAGSLPPPMRLAQANPAPPEQTINGRPLTDAPIPGPLPGVSPVDRAAGPGSRDLNAGPVNATPFSAGPTTALQSGSQASPNGTAGGDVTPNLGK